METGSNYKKSVEELINTINKNIIDLSISRERSTPPTQASSEFLTNKHQGDWAEQTLLTAINNSSSRFIAVKYGLDMDLVAGDPGFKEFYERYQDELDSVGKKPDLLIFKKSDYKEEWGLNISEFNEDDLDRIVPLAICGIEVRSSSFMYETYEKYSKNKIAAKTQNVLRIKDEILQNYGFFLLKKKPDLFNALNSLNENNLHESTIKFVTSKSTPEFVAISDLMKELKDDLAEIKKRDFLSITPKVEDLKVVYNWITKYGIPHFYFQVFFDSAFGISFVDVLKLASDDTKLNIDYFIEKDVKNQNKTTIKINTRRCVKVMENISIPPHKSGVKKLGDRGRLMFYVDFDCSSGDINASAFNNLIGCEVIDE